MNKQIAATLTAIICVRLSSDHQILTLNSNDYNSMWTIKEANK